MMSPIKSIQHVALPLTVVMLVTGCSLSEPRRAEADFGNSVRNMIAEQTYNPNASAENGTEISEAYSGQLGEEVMDVYHGDVAKPKEIAKPIKIQIGN